MKPIEDPEFDRLLSLIDSDTGGVEDAEDWEDAFISLDGLIADLEDEIDRALAARDYAEKQDTERQSKQPDTGQPTSGWICSGCKTGTLSRCRECDEATCGYCLATHVCELVTA